jgi:inhibitor of cysteine peptidase
LKIIRLISLFPVSRYSINRRLFSSAKEYTSADQSISAAVGEQFTIKLEGNATTGFQWPSAFDAAYLKQVKSEYVVDKSKTGMVGVGGNQYFTFQALKAGSTEVKCTYERSFDKGKDAKYATFKVTIK